MCGRYALQSSVPELARTLDAHASDAPGDPCGDLSDAALAPCYNIAPTRQVPVLITDQGARALRRMRWGLVPHWSAGPDSRWAMHNARIENITSKPAYRGPVRHQRCLIPASGWYEWQSVNARKQPWLIRHRVLDTVCFAGLWERWQGEDSTIVSCTILTAPAAAPIDAVHHRMPIIVAEEKRDSWMDPACTDAGVALACLQPLHAADLEAVAVSTHVNNARNDDPRCMQPLQPDD